MNERRGSKLTFVVALAAAALAGASASYLWLAGAEAPPALSTNRLAARYRCPMHPTMVSERPDDCPICGMRMIPRETDEPAGRDSPATAEGAQPAVDASAATKRIVYRSTMNPSEIADHPGKDSMGMDMVAEEVESAAAGGGPAVEGRVRVQLAERRRQLIGVRTTLAVRKPLTRTVKAVGRVTPDETRLRHVHTKVDGWVDRLFANATGELVREGDPLLSLYSPELVASAQEYLIAWRAAKTLGEAPLPAVRDSGERMLASARQRLLLFGLTPAQIAALESKGEVPTAMTLHAPAGGYILMRNVTQGEKIDSGTNLLDIADLSRVWVLAEVYEYELPFVRLGQKATMRLSYLPGKTFEGRVTLIYPMLSDATRTVKVRIEVPNPDIALKPEMYAEVEIQSELGQGLVIPGSAVMSTGKRDIAFVDSGDGYFEPRELEIGTRLADEVEILSGLAEGEHVLTAGNFFIDSESKLKAALADAGRGSDADGHAH